MLAAGKSLTVPFIESFDKLSGNSQQALQQLVTHGSKLIPEGSSVRDSFEKLSGSTQHALYHLANSGLSLPSLLPHKQSHETGNTAVPTAADSKAAKAKVAQLMADLSTAEKENASVSDLLQHSQHELALTQARTHDLLASAAHLEDQRSLLASENMHLQGALKKVLEAKECIQQQCAVCDGPTVPDQACPPCRAAEDANELYGTFGSQVRHNVFYIVFSMLPRY